MKVRVYSSSTGYFFSRKSTCYSRQQIPILISMSIRRSLLSGYVYSKYRCEHQCRDYMWSIIRLECTWCLKRVPNLAGNARKNLIIHRFFTFKIDILIIFYKENCARFIFIAKLVIVLTFFYDVDMVILDFFFCPACRTSLIATRFWVVVICPIIKCLTVLEFSFILFDLCLFITIFNFILNYVPIVTFWIFTYHKIWMLLIIFCFIWNYWIIYFLTCLEVFWSVVS